MGTKLASEIIGLARKVLQDNAGDRWPDADMLDWLNEGQREAVLIKPAAYVKNVAVQLVTGTKQTIPADGVMLAGVIRNMGADGSTPGAAIRKSGWVTLDEMIPDWHSFTPDATVKFFVFDQADPKTFYVFPPQPGSPGYVEQAYSANPPDVAATDSAITLDDIYSGVLLDYLLFRAYSLDAEETGSGERAASYYSKFTSTLEKGKV